MSNSTKPISARPREIERDARAWAKFSGMKYTQALRLMEHPLAQGILGDRLCARDVIRILTEHATISAQDAASGDRIAHLGANGLRSAHEHPLEISTEDDYLTVVLTAEVLRMFDRTEKPNSDAYSYGLKHTAEQFLGEHLADFSYVANGTAIWAAATLGIPIAPSSPDEPTLNADFGLVSEQVDYARRMRRSSGSQRERIRAHHFRPPGYAYLRHALEIYKATGQIPARWNGVDENAEPMTSPFHQWLVSQIDRNGGLGESGSRERLAGDYEAGFRTGDHSAAQQPEELIHILRGLNADEQFIEMARVAIVDWARTAPESIGIRTELTSDSRDTHSGWGAGSGDTERYEYLCPCGHGRIIEEHDNVPGFREHSHAIACEVCRTEWQFVDGLSTRNWRIEPIRAA